MSYTPGEEKHGRNPAGQLGLNGLLVSIALLVGLALSKLFGFGVFLIIPLFFVWRFKSPSAGTEQDHTHTDEREQS